MEQKWKIRINAQLYKSECVIHYRDKDRINRPFMVSMYDASMYVLHSCNDSSVLIIMDHDVVLIYLLNWVTYIK